MHQARREGSRHGEHHLKHRHRGVHTNGTRMLDLAVPQHTGMHVRLLCPAMCRGVLISATKALV